MAIHENLSQEVLLRASVTQSLRVARAEGVGVEYSRCHLQNPRRARKLLESHVPHTADNEVVRSGSLLWQAEEAKETFVRVIRSTMFPMSKSLLARIYLHLCLSRNNLA